MAVYERGKKWEMNFRDQNGKRRYETYDTKREARDAEAQRRMEVREGTYRAPTDLPSFESVAQRWIAGKRLNVRASTLSFWQGHLDNHILPKLGTRRIDLVRLVDLEQFRDHCHATGLAGATVNKLLQTVTAVMSYAAKHRMIDHNPTQHVERATRAGKGRAVNPEDVLSLEEAGRLLGAALTLRQRAYLTAAIYTGAREGELLATTWDDLDLPTRGESGRMHIRRSLSWAKTKEERGGEPKPRLVEPKTRAGNRVLPLAPELVRVLREWRMACPAGELGLVFPNDRGGPWQRSLVRRYVLLPALEAAKLKSVTVHSLRHTFASGLIQRGSPVTQVAHLLGHSSPNITLATYSHWFDGLTSETEVVALADFVSAARSDGCKVAASSAGERQKP